MASGNGKVKSSDQILNGYMDQFSEQFDLESQIPYKRPEEIYTAKFECFTGALALHDACPSAGMRLKDPMSLSLGGGDEKGLDSVIVVVNKIHIVEDLSEFESLQDDLREEGREIDSVDFIFSQAKTSPSFTKSLISTTILGVEQFMRSGELHTSNEALLKKRKIKDAVYECWTEIKNVGAYLYYFTQSPNPLNETVHRDIMEKIDSMNESGGVFSDFAKKGGNLTFIPCGLDDVKNMYEKYKKYEQRVNFKVDASIALPEINEIKKSFMTYIYFDEFLKIILRDPNGRDLDESIFEENVRSFQGTSNKVNSKILSTLKDGGANKFFILNNGITMIADKVATDNRNEKFTAHNYQIINGCQSSTMLYYYYLHLLDSGIGESEIQERLKEVYIPLKIIEVRGDSLASEIVESTNSQSSIGADQLHALGNVAREIQKFFNVNKEEGTGKQYMYYERRNNEYAYDSVVVKSRVITQDMMLGIFAAMYLEMPHKSSRYAGRLKTEEILRKVFNDENPPIKFFAAAYAYLRYTAENRRHSQLQTSLKWHTLMVYRILFGDVYSKTSLSNKFNPEQEVKRIDESLSSCDNLLIANNIVLKFMSDNPAYSKLSIRTINKKEEFTNDLIKYTQILKGRKSKDKYNEYLEYVFNESNVSGVGGVETLNPSDTTSSGNSLPGCTVYSIPELTTVLENAISEDASHLFNRIFDGTIEWGNLTFRWRNSDQKNSTYKFYIYISSKSGSTPVKVGQVVYGKRDKDFKINLGLQHKQLEENPKFYNEFINRKIDGFTCDFSDKRNEKNNIEYGRIIFNEKSSDDLLVLINDIASKTCIVKNSMI